MSAASSPRSLSSKRIFALLFLIATVLASLGPPAAMSAPARINPDLLAYTQSHPAASVRVIVRYESDSQSVARVIAGLGGRVVSELRLIGALVAELPAARAVELSSTSGVTWVAEDAPVEERACTGCVSTAASTSSWLSTIGLKDLWGFMPEAQGQGVTVAVIDSGIADHEDLRWSSSSRRVIDVRPGTITSPNTPAGLLSVSAASASATVNVSAEGTADWARWSWPGYFAEERPWSRPQQIGQLAHPGTSSLSGLSDVVQYSWNLLKSPSSVALSGAGKSFGLSVKADRLLKTLKLYVSATNGSGTLEAYLSDGSALPFSSTVSAPTGRTRSYVYTLTYAALSDGQSLTIRWLPATGEAKVAIAAATLVNGGVDPRPVVTTSSNAIDQFGHGTHVAGIIAGNGAASAGRIIGVAPMANLINVRVNDAQGQATVADVIAGLEWIYNNSATYNIRVVNMSLNSTVAESYHQSALDAAVELLWFKGIVVVVSAGNNGDDGKLYPPANDPFVITVGASDDRGTPSTGDDTIAPFSARGTSEAGTSKPEIMAPGVNIVSLTCASCTMNTTYAQYRASGFTGAERYFRASGTSMSAAMVSGAVALMLQRTPSLDPDQVKQLLISTGWHGPFSYTDPRYLQAGWAVTSTPLGRANTGILVSRAVDLQGNKKDVVWDSAKMGWGSAKMGWGSALWASQTLLTSMTRTTSTMSVNWGAR